VTEKRRRAFHAHFWPVGPFFLDSEGNLPSEYGEILKFKNFFKLTSKQSMVPGGGLFYGHILVFWSF